MSIRILVDMDGVVADFDRHLWDHAQAEGWELDFDCIKTSTNRKRFITDNMPNRDHRRACRSLIEVPGFFAVLPEIEGAVEGVQSLVDAGFDVWFCTKPLESNYTCRDDKAAWVRKRWPHLEEKLILAPNKSLIHGDILLDDAIKPDWVPQATWKPVVYDQPFNREGSVWETWDRWSWGQPIQNLLTVLDL